MADRNTFRLMLIILGVIFAFLYIPISVLVGLSFNEGGLPTAWTGFSFKWYGALLENEDILKAAGNTLIVAIFSTLLSTLLGSLLAIGVEIRRRNGKWLETLIFAPMIIPDIVLAIALLSFFSLIGVKMGLHTIIVSHVVFNLAFVCAVVRARLKNFDWSIVEASADLGASTFTTLKRVIIPVLMPAIVAGALLAFTLSVDEFIIAFFTAGAGRASITLPMQIFAMIRFGVTPEINALATLVMAVSVIALALSQRLNKGGLPGQ
ncbi:MULTISPECIES: ABC transporter permease [Roseobacteraceae]|uniref:Spermidine/putrescine ABC transporter permease n=1 Tax=Celeribacter baekdonensis B30 TaxID=1208323 RepID=K2K2Z0_9RHOB|nr:MULTISPECIES: ABC transporter permease [Roseobacteraceae]EKE71860.1 spermidine/putrescine ABC transporter permease [Celeribacter baekdonensis B30]KAB6715289.1 ABC transporter permease [Roseobacter sp. TSBP12]|tara:strand:- start:21301 stop:22092 length:792 start_codon:yes stop_codon:yes gene_type:complete